MCQTKPYTAVVTLPVTPKKHCITFHLLCYTAFDVCTCWHGTCKVTVQQEKGYNESHFRGSLICFHEQASVCICYVSVHVRNIQYCAVQYDPCSDSLMVPSKMLRCSAGKQLWRELWLQGSCPLLQQFMPSTCSCVMLIIRLDGLLPLTCSVTCVCKVVRITIAYCCSVFCETLEACCTLMIIVNVYIMQMVTHIVVLGYILLRNCIVMMRNVFRCLIAARC